MLKIRLGTKCGPPHDVSSLRKALGPRLGHGLFLFGDSFLGESGSLARVTPPPVSFAISRVLCVFIFLADIVTPSSKRFFFLSFFSSFFSHTSLLSSFFWTSRGHRCRPLPPPIPPGSCRHFFYRAWGSAIPLIVDFSSSVADSRSRAFR